MNSFKEAVEKHFEVESKRERKGATYPIRDILIVVLLGTLCKLQDLSEIHTWATNKRIRGFLYTYFGIKRLPGYSQFTVIFGLIKPGSLNKCFMEWTNELRPDKEGLTISLDGKTVRSTVNMKNYDRPLHIVSAQISELGIGQLSVDGKTNEIPTVRDLIALLDIKGSVVVADAINCQKETAAAIKGAGADFLLTAKGNQPKLQSALEEQIQSKLETLEKASTFDVAHGRVEARTAYVEHDIKSNAQLGEWPGTQSIGAVQRATERNGKITIEWHYYITSKKMGAEELLERARKEWSVESMHWLLDVHFGEDSCHLFEQNSLENLNIVRKTALNKLRIMKIETNDKTSISKLMLNCLLDCEKILDVFANHKL